jgi:hypothetical protein
MYCSHKIAARLGPLSTDQQGYSTLQCDLHRGNWISAVHAYLAEFQLSTVVILDCVAYCETMRWSNCKITGIITAAYTGFSMFTIRYQPPTVSWQQNIAWNELQLTQVYKFCDARESVYPVHVVTTSVYGVQWNNLNKLLTLTQSSPSRRKNGDCTILQ